MFTSGNEMSLIVFLKTKFNEIDIPTITKNDTQYNINCKKVTLMLIVTKNLITR